MSAKILAALGLACFVLASSGQSKTDRAPAGAAKGRSLFLKNCAHCHGADGRGDDGPDLHGLELSDQAIVNRIRNGKKGQMTAFAGKLQQVDMDALLAYLRTLK